VLLRVWHARAERDNGAPAASFEWQRSRTRGEREVPVGHIGEQGDLELPRLPKKYDRNPQCVRLSTISHQRRSRDASLPVLESAVPCPFASPPRSQDVDPPPSISPGPRGTWWSTSSDKPSQPQRPDRPCRRTSAMVTGRPIPVRSRPRADPSKSARRLAATRRYDPGLILRGPAEVRAGVVPYERWCQRLIHVHSPKQPGAVPLTHLSSHGHQCGEHGSLGPLEMGA